MAWIISEVGTGYSNSPFALVIFNGYSPHRLFFLWGLAYLVAGWYYRVPVAVQPLKAMAVIALASGYQVPQLASAACSVAAASSSPSSWACTGAALTTSRTATQLIKATFHHRSTRSRDSRSFLLMTLPFMPRTPGPID